MSTTSAILSAIRTQLLTVSGTHADRTRIGKMPPPAGVSGLWLNIIPLQDKGDWIDGDGVRRTLEVIVIAYIRTDAGSATAEAEQLIASYDAIHDAMEDLVKNNLGGIVNRMEEDAAGVEYDAYDDGDYIAVAGSTWRIEHDRTLGSDD